MENNAETPKSAKTASKLFTQQNKMASFAAIDSFDPKKSTFTRWIQRLECGFQINKTPNENKLPLLYTMMGQDAYEILCDKLLPGKPTDPEVTYESAKSLLKEHLEPKALEIYECFKFHCCKQAQTESIAQFVDNLKRLAAHCNFDVYLDKAVRNQLVLGVKEQKIQDRLLEQDDLTLEKAIALAKSLELSLKGTSEMKKASIEVNAIEKRSFKSKPTNQRAPKKKKNYVSQNKSSNNKCCYRCGAETHLANACKHKDTVCDYCKKKGHLERVCLQAKAEKKEGNKKLQNGYVETVQSNYMDEILQLDLSNDPLQKYLMNVNVNGKQFQFEVDTGSPVSIISYDTKRRFFEKIPLLETKKQMIGYGGNPIKIYGYILVKVSTSKASAELPLYVVESDKHPLLGREWLNQISLDWNAVLKVHCNTVEVPLSTNVHNTTKSIEILLQKHSALFREEIGKIEGMKARLTLKANARPVFIKARKVPFSIKALVEKELSKLETEGVLEKVNFSTWATPIVPVKKSGDRVRICGDYKITVNPNLIVDEHPLPTIDELFANMSGGQKFSKIDLTQAYLQMEVEEDNRELLTLSTHMGLYRPTRLMYGVASAPALFQRNMEQILAGIQGVEVFIDDVKVTGPNDETHIERLNEVFTRLSKHNMRVNLKKSEFLVNEINYCGYRIDKSGIHKMQEKTDAIRKMPAPRNREELRALIGFVNYYARFFPKLAEIMYPMNNLLKKEVDFHWCRKCERAFAEIKREMTSERVLAHYNPELPLVLATDASNYAVGAVLSHIYPDGTERPIQYASQTLSPTQQRYPMVDKEAYAIIYGVRKFYQYVYSRKFTLFTDNKAVKQIFMPGKGLPILSATRMQHYAVYLESFDYEIKHRKSEENANADALSRLPLKDTNDVLMDEIDVLQTEIIETLPVTVKELSAETDKDENVKILMQGLMLGTRVSGKDRYGIDQQEFTVQRGCLMRGIRAYIPKSLRDRVLAELHSGHFGITRMKSLARGFCWWNTLDRDITDMVQNCSSCQLVRDDPKKVPVHQWEPAVEPFQRVHIDFAGPFLNGMYFFILIDAYTKWPEVELVTKITSDVTIQICRKIFARFGNPRVLVSDNGPQLTSDEFEKFLIANGIKHKLTAPYNPSTNGLAERNVHTFKQKLLTDVTDKATLHTKLQTILMNYRITKHATTNESPSMRMFGRNIRSRLDLIVPSEQNFLDREEKYGKIRELKTGERVMARNYANNKKTWRFGTIESRIGLLHYHVKLDDGRLWKRHINQIREVGSKCGQKSHDKVANNGTTTCCGDSDDATRKVNSKWKFSNDGIDDKNVSVSDSSDDDSHGSDAEPASVDPHVEIAAPSLITPRRSTRFRQPPRRLNL